MSNSTLKVKPVQRLTEIGVMLALATAFSYVTLFSLPMGGSVTLFSQVPIIIIGYRYGIKWGFTTGVIHGLLQMILQGLGNFAYVKGVAAYLILIFFDYVLAFSALGIGGAMFKKVFKNQAAALAAGTTVACALRFICHFISGITIWGEYADGWKSVWQYSAAYNGGYMLCELVLSLAACVALSFIINLNSVNLKRK